MAASCIAYNILCRSTAFLVQGSDYPMVMTALQSQQAQIHGTARIICMLLIRHAQSQAEVRLFFHPRS